MPSLFPRQIDKIPFVAGSVAQVPKSTSTDANMVPARTLYRLYDGLDQLERHLGFSIASAGDVLVDGTNIAANTAGRIIAPLSAIIRVPANYNSRYSFLLNWSSVFDETEIANARPTAAPGGDIQSGNPTPTLLTQDPLIITAKRLTSGLKGSQIYCIASIVPSTTGKPFLCISATDLTLAFSTNEPIQINALFWGGI